MRRVQVLGLHFSGSGLPIPLKGSRSTSRISPRMRAATRASDSAQYVRSSRHWDWRIATRSARRGGAAGPDRVAAGGGALPLLPAKPELRLYLIQRNDAALPPHGLRMRRLETASVRRRAQQVSGLAKALQLRCGDEGDVLGSAALDRDDL